MGPGRLDVGLLGVAVLGISASAPIIAATAAPALAISLWRNVLGGGVLLAVAAAREGAATFRLTADERRWTGLAAIALAVHFATWVPSVTLTTVAASTALVATQPVWNALIARARGEAVSGREWLGIGIALAGVLVLTGVDVTTSARAVLGDVLALVGAVAAAAYVEFGAQARRTMSTSAYAGLVYVACAVPLLLACLVGRVALTGFPVSAWVGIVALTVLAQLLGHTLVNRALRTIPPVVVSMAILLEPVGATALAAVWLGQVPPLAVLPAGLLVLGGVALVVTGRRASASSASSVVAEP